MCYEHIASRSENTRTDYLNYRQKKKLGAHSGNQYKRFRVTSQIKRPETRAKNRNDTEGGGEGEKETLGSLRVTLRENGKRQIQVENFLE